MKKCKKCHEEIQDGAKKCKHCGADLRNWFARHKIITGFLAVVLFFIIVGSLADSEDKDGIANTDNNSVTEQKTEVVKDNQNQPAEKTPSQEVKETVNQNKVPVVNDDNVKEKTYQEILSFSGNGAKNSEPFVISGDRFKIKYSCTGDLCQAWLNYVNGDSLKSLIMNTMDPVDDETIIYGAGEYYIQSNTIGNYSFTVFEYK